MGFSDSEKACKDHPYHNQKQGVCPSCLRERLSQLYIVVSGEKEAAAAMAGPSSSSSMSFSSAYSSNHLSPGLHNHQYHHQRNMSDIMGSISFRVSAGNGLKKSRSVAFVARSSLVGDVKHGTKKNKKKGFWSKLLHLKGKNKEVNFPGKFALNV
ncbi:uncharacterized protein LOC110627642 [Manihot esculenta]|uniref:Uncharacterized protein n=1 Tax=Manihot esculenta TaxID=3983 RepID=A0A2C9UW59_MANES|nr:uncharacterized protein LOC110627642 [Manihot esculenta]OAY35781.1 hypothetical protein MANES_12G129900v8 [Manihot esculenta]